MDVLERIENLLDMCWEIRLELAKAEIRVFDIRLGKTVETEKEKYLRCCDIVDNTGKFGEGTRYCDWKAEVDKCMEDEWRYKWDYCWHEVGQKHPNGTTNYLGKVYQCIAETFGDE